MRFFFPIFPHVVTCYKFTIAINYSISNVMYLGISVRKSVMQFTNRTNLTLRNYVLVSYTCKLWHRTKLNFRTHDFQSSFQSQLNFMGVTKEYIVLDVKRYSVLWIVLGACISFGMYYLRVYPPHLEYWQLPSYYVSVLLMKITLTLWACINTSLKKSARNLNKCFKVSDCCIQHSTSRQIF